MIFDKVKFLKEKKLSKKLITVFSLLVAGIFLGGCQVPSFGLYRGATTQGQDTFKIFVGFIIASLIVGGIVWLLMFWAMFRYRRKKGDDSLPKQFHDNRIVEIVYTIIPFIIVCGLFYFTILTENNVDAVSSHPYLNVKVTAFQWGWQFAYTFDENGTTKTALVFGSDAGSSYSTHNMPVAVMPVGEPIKITLVSNDVVHGFYVPAFNFSRYAQPGYTNYFDLNIVNPGYYPGRCTQYCGVYHTEMLFGIRAVSPNNFVKWINSHPSNLNSLVH
jgi:cytochrome c oxidase subunit 2